MKNNSQLKKNEIRGYQQPKNSKRIKDIPEDNHTFYSSQGANEENSVDYKLNINQSKSGVSHYKQPHSNEN